MTSANPPPSPNQPSTDEREFLLKEYEHWTQSYLQNEESGEKRLNFFVTIVAGVFAAIGFFAKDGKEVLGSTGFHTLTTFAAAVLLVLGLLTVARLKRRNETTDLCLKRVKELREILGPKSWSNSSVEAISKVKRKRTVAHGGLAYMAGVIALALAVVLVWSIHAGLSAGPR